MGEAPPTQLVSQRLGGADEDQVEVVYFIAGRGLLFGNHRSVAFARRG